MSPALLSLADPMEAHVADRLAAEPILWLGTVSPHGRPHTVPVWFGWTDPTITVFSRPDTAKVTRLRTNGAVSFSLDSAASGADIVLGEGHAELIGPDEAARDRAAVAGFARKYDAMLGGQPFDDWLTTFSEAIRITVDKLIAWSVGPGGLDYRVFPRS